MIYYEYVTFHYEYFCYISKLKVNEEFEWVIQIWADSGQFKFIKFDPRMGWKEDKKIVMKSFYF